MDFLKKYDIEINDKELLLTALTHSSYAFEHNVSSYERLEYLGDAVLELVVSDYLYLNEKLTEGEMSRKRASFVCEEALFEYSKEVGYLPYIRVGNGQIEDINESIIADIFEAILGTIYLDQGYEIAKKYLYKIVIPKIKEGRIFMHDYKSALQELTQVNQKTPEYVITSEEGPANNRTFKAIVKVDGIIYGKGIGHSKKEAEQKAAQDAFRKEAK